MLDLLCPVCGGRLVRKEKAWRCENHHCFDVARSGYVNLLPPSASGKRHGDDKHMVAARTAFLSRGYYDHLIGAVAGSCAQLTGPDACVLDAGCGEGTYTRAIYDALAAKGGCPQLLGADISAEAVRRAARQVPEGDLLRGEHRASSAGGGKPRSDRQYFFAAHGGGVPAGPEARRISAACCADGTAPVRAEGRRL